MSFAGSESPGDALVLARDGGVAARFLVEALALVVDVMAAEQPGSSPYLDGPPCNSEPLGQLAGGQHSCFAQPIIPAFQAVGFSDVADEKPMQVSAFAGPIAAFIQELGDLPVGVLVEESVDLCDHRGMGLP